MILHVVLGLFGKVQVEYSGGFTSWGVDRASNRAGDRLSIRLTVFFIQVIYRVTWLILLKGVRKYYAHVVSPPSHNEAQGYENNTFTSLNKNIITYQLYYTKAQYNRSKVAGHCVRSKTKMSDPCVRMSVH